MNRAPWPGNANPKCDSKPYFLPLSADTLRGYRQTGHSQTANEPSKMACAFSRLNASQYHRARHTGHLTERINQIPVPTVMDGPTNAIIMYQPGLVACLPA